MNIAQATTRARKILAQRAKKAVSSEPFVFTIGPDDPVPEVKRGIVLRLSPEPNEGSNPRGLDQ